MMRKSKELMQAIRQTDASIEHQRRETEKELSSPSCYALPLCAFVIGLTLHKVVAHPIRLITRIL